MRTDYNHAPTTRKRHICRTSSTQITRNDFTINAPMLGASKTHSYC